MSSSVNDRDMLKMDIAELIGSLEAFQRRL